MTRSPVLAAFLIASSILRDIAADEPRPVTVFVAGKIHTMDPGWPVATVHRHASQYRNLAELQRPERCDPSA